MAKNDPNNTSLKVTVDGREAKKELRAITAEAEKVNQKIKEAYANGDTKEVKKLEKDFNLLQRKARNFEKAYFSVDGVLKNLSHSTTRDLRKALRELNRQMNAPGIERGSKEYREYAAQIRTIKDELKSISKEQYSQQGFFSRMSGSAAMSIAALTGVTLSVSDLIEKNNQLEDSASNLKSLTGLDDNAIAYLTDQAKQLSTQATETGMRVRDSADEILNAYTIVGSNKPELLGSEEDLNKVTRYALMLKVASKDISSTTDAAEALTVSLNQYSAGADQAERYTNALAASAQKGSANVAMQTASLKNAGVAMAQANVSFESSLALIQTLSEKGIKGEVAGTGLKKLFLTLQTGADETNPKIVGLGTALENLAKKEMDAAAIKKEFGEEGYNVTSVILSNIDAFKAYEKEITDTNIAVENAAINSNNAAARTAQYKNDIVATGMALTKDLQPALEIGMMSFSGLLKLLLLLSPAIKILTACMIAYTVASRINNAVTKEGLLLSNLKIAKGSILTASTYAQAAAYAILNGKIKRANQAMSLMFKTLGLSPWGAITAAVVAAGAAIYMLAKRQSESNRESKLMSEVLKDANRSIAEEKTKLEILLATARNENLSRKDRIDAIKQINELSPEYLGNITLESVNTDTARKSIDAYTTALERKARARAAEKRMMELEQKILDNSIKANQYDTEADAAAKRGGERKDYNYDKAESLRKENKELAKQKELLISLIHVDSSARTEVGVGGEIIAANAELKSLKEKYDALSKQIKEVKKDPLDFKNTSLTKELHDVNRQIIETEKKLEILKQKNKKENTGGGGGGNPDKDAALKKELERLEELRGRAISSFKKQLLNKEITEEEYRKRSEYLDLAHLGQKKNALEKYGQSTTELYNQILDKLLSMQKDAKAGINIELEPEELSYDADVYNTVKKHRETEEGKRLYLKALYETKALDFEEYQDRLSEIEEDAERKRAEIVANAETEKKEKREKAMQAIESITNNAASIVRAIHDRQLQEIELRYARELELAGDNADERAAIEAKMEAEKKELRKKQADVQFVMDIASIAVNTSIAAMRAYADLGPVAGPIAAGMVSALGLVQIAQANQQRETVKNLWTGGYTGSGLWNEPKGIVHSDEFVGSRFAVANPTVRRIFDIVDHAQRNNYVGRLTPNDFITTLDYRETPSAHTVPSGKMNDRTRPDREIVDLSPVAEALNRVSETLEKPIKAYTTVAGPGGSDEASRLFDKLNKNSKR